MPDEPRRHPIFMLLVAVAALGAVPFLFIGSGGELLLGLPIWLWSSIGFTIALSLLTVPGPKTRTPRQLRAFLRRRLLPAIGLGAD